MALSKKDAPGAAKPVEVEEEEVVEVAEPAHPGDLTPSAYALSVVGEFKGEPGSRAALAHGERYQAEKSKRRLGH